MDRGRGYGTWIGDVNESGTNADQIEFPELLHTEVLDYSKTLWPGSANFTRNFFFEFRKILGQMRTGQTRNFFFHDKLRNLIPLERSAPEHYKTVFGFGFEAFGARRE